MYSDESWYLLNDRFWSIWVLSWINEDFLELSTSLSEILEKNQCSEIKYSWISWHAPKMNSCLKFIEVYIKFFASCKIYFDCITWDREDSRHQINNIDKFENYVRMYYHILNNVSKRHIYNHKACTIYPDEQEWVNRQDLEKYLESKHIDKSKNTLFWKTDNVAIKISWIYPKESKHEPVIQLVDLLCGIVNFSHSYWEDYLQRLETNKWDTLLFKDSWKQEVTWKKVLQKFKILEKLLNESSKKKLWLSINTSKHLKTHNSSKSFCIRKYEPQWGYDKAPIKK